MSDPQLPRIGAVAVNANGNLTPEFYLALSATITSLRQQITTVAAVVDAITDGTGNLQSLGTLLASKQNASEDLDAIAEIVGGGLVSRSALGDWNTRVLQEPGAGLTITNPDGRDGDPAFVLADDIAAVEGLTTTGVAVRTAESTWATRTLAGTADRITVTNGDGVAGAPTFDIGETYAGQTSITTLGTVATGTWNATAISLAKGGTGQDYSTRVANTVWSGPATGADAAPTFRALVKADLQAVVADALVDGVTDVAPSQNAVVDALALKAAIPAGYIDGLQLQWVSTTAITVTSGSAYIEDSANIVPAPSAIAKTSLSLSASTLYHVYLYLNAGTPDVEIVTTAPVAYSGTARSKTGDTSRRYLGSVVTNSSAGLRPFLMQGDLVSYYGNKVTGSFDFRLLLNGAATTRTTVSCATFVPVTASFASMKFTNAAPDFAARFDNSESQTTGSEALVSLAPGASAFADIPVDASQALQYFMTGTPSSGGAILDLLGYRFAR